MTRYEVKPVARNGLLARLATMKNNAPWEIFPYKALVAAGEIDALYELLR